MSVSTVTTDQILCVNCEELVHRSCSSCPYCQKNTASKNMYTEPVPSYQATNYQTDLEELNRSLSSINQESHPKPSKIERLTSDYVPEKEHAAEAVTTVNQLQGFVEFKNTIYALLGIVWGSFLLLFSLLLFSQRSKGVLTIEWNASTWYYSFIAAIALFAFGLIYYRKN